MKIILVALIFINLITLSCGKKAEADGGYRLEYIHGYKCITNDVSIWCD